MTKLLFFGSGAAFTVGADNYQSNILLIHEQGDRLLIDCGSDIRFSLHAAGFSYLDITDIYVSHLHSDHAGGLEYMAFTTLIPGAKNPIYTLVKISLAHCGKIIRWFNLCARGY